MPIRSTSISSSLRSGSSGAVSRDGEPPALFGVEPPKPRIEAVRVVDMSTSNVWAEFADIFIRTKDAHFEHERAKAELKGLLPEDAQTSLRPWHSSQALEVGSNQLRPPEAGV